MHSGWLALKRFPSAEFERLGKHFCKATSPIAKVRSGQTLPSSLGAARSLPLRHRGRMVELEALGERQGRAPLLDGGQEKRRIQPHSSRDFLVCGRVVLRELFGFGDAARGPDLVAGSARGHSAIDDAPADSADVAANDLDAVVARLTADRAAGRLPDDHGCSPVHRFLTFATRSNSERSGLKVDRGEGFLHRRTIAG